MVKIERIIINGEEYSKVYSDGGFYIKQDQTGKEYCEAIDKLPCQYTYSETIKLIKKGINL